MERDVLMVRFLVGCLVLAVLNVAEVEPEEDVLPDADDEVRAGRCNQFRHVPGCGNEQSFLWGRMREGRTKAAVRLFRVNPSASMHTQIKQLADALDMALHDGVYLSAVLYRPEFGSLVLECGNSSPTHQSRKGHDGHHAHGTKHALEFRHGVSSKDVAAALLLGTVEQHEGVASRLKVRYNNVMVILERERAKGSGRISQSSARLHTAMRIK